MITAKSADRIRLATSKLIDEFANPTTSLEDKLKVTERLIVVTQAVREKYVEEDFIDGYFYTFSKE